MVRALLVTVVMALIFVALCAVVIGLLVYAIMTEMWEIVWGMVIGYVLAWVIPGSPTLEAKSRAFARALWRHHE